MNLPTPEPAAGLDNYYGIIQDRISASKQCADNYFKYLVWNRDGGPIDFLPIKLDIENVSRCNFSCVMCAVSDWKHNKRAHDMSLYDFQYIIDEQYGLLEIKLQGLGEPIMQGNDYFAMIRYARDQGIWVRTTTNASLLHLHDNYKRLMDSDPNEVQISVDAADKRTFETIRRGSVFERVISNIKLLNTIGSRVTKMWTVVQKANVDNLMPLVDLAHELGFTNQVFSLDVMNWGLPDRNLSAVPQQLEGLVERGKELGHKVWFWNMAEKYTTKSPCQWPFERAYISSDMRVVPCCVIGNPDVAELGDMSEGFTNVWNSERYKEFRNAHTTGEIPSFCKECYARH